MIASPLLFVLAFLAITRCTHGRNGVDLSVATTLSDWQCLVSSHAVEYAIVRLFRNLGLVDSNAPNSLKAASQVGIRDLGGYMFPCMPSSSFSVSKNTTCAPAKDQALSTVRFLEENNVFIKRTRESANKVIPEDAVLLNRVWIDIEDESPAKYYDASPAPNQAFIADLVGALEAMHIPVGIYTTKTYWQNIMGNASGYDKYPLWYPRYDGVSSFEFFSPFAGWSEAQIKQTAGDSAWCSISQVDSDYMLDA